ncbi:MAG TPA: condensation domain-containing protein, partial [Terriglobia bacterium]|nr:condensation domain-containing protein [Terriglobia bacterium]
MASERSREHSVNEWSELSPAKRQLLERRFLGQLAGNPRSAKVPRRTGSGPFPLSFGQQRLWFLDQIEPSSPLYSVGWAAELRGPLNLDALRLAFNTIVKRHESLRTTYSHFDGSPVQVIAEDRLVEWSLFNLETADPVSQTSDVNVILKKEAQRPFDLSRDLMLRATLIRLGPEQAILLIVIHHIASDGWSMGVLLEELRAGYAAF